MSAILPWGSVRRGNNSSDCERRREGPAIHRSRRLSGLNLYMAEAGYFVGWVAE